ncbi:MAG TPA: GGDEF domain-containing protein [Candidatus Limnocylindrales bacterium]|nr:GGDEF domain-containing protein [Candidatus Limnocylindrales bacterium]
MNLRAAPAAQDSRRRRDRATRAKELRRILRIGSLLVAGILLAAGVILAARFPARSAELVAVWTGGAAVSLALYFTAARATQRSVVPLTVLLTLGPAAGLLVTATVPAALLAVSAGFTMLPVAVPLFLAWNTALRTAWLVVYTLIFGGLTLVTGLGYLDAVQRVDLASNVLIGSAIGWVGGVLLERLRARNLDQEIELRRLNHELRVGATTDALTGLANRRQLEADLVWLSAARPGRLGTCAFLMLDLDRFKRLNDDLGHAVGDTALRIVSGELRRVIRGSDTIYRYGGEEFLVIMPDSTLEAATAAAERIRAAIADLRIKASTEPGASVLTISCGVALSLVARESWGTVIAAADSALYQAKASGRNRTCVIPATVGEEATVMPRDRRRPTAR